MSDPALALQGQIYTALTDGDGVGVGQRVYDSVPDPVEFPYIRIGDDQTVGDDNDCEDLSRVYVRVHIWSRDIGFPETKRIAAAVRQRVRTWPYVLEGFAVDNVKFENAVNMNDPDGKSRHGVVEFEFLISHL